MHTIFTSEYCIPMRMYSAPFTVDIELLQTSAHQDVHKYILTSTCTKLYYKLYYSVFAVATVPHIFFLQTCFGMGMHSSLYHSLHPVQETILPPVFGFVELDLILARFCRRFFHFT